jgi:hypothetical protein
MNEETAENYNNASEYCYYCSLNEKAHSFKRKKGYFSPTLQVYETIIKDAELYNDPDSIIFHIERCLKYNLKETPIWNWAIDFEGAGIKHYFSFNTVIKLCQWINREKNGLCKELKHIYVLNGYKILTLSLVKMAKLFLPSHIEVEIIE